MRLRNNSRRLGVCRRREIDFSFVRKIRCCSFNAIQREPIVCNSGIALCAAIDVRSTRRWLRVKTAASPYAGRGRRNRVSGGDLSIGASTRKSCRGFQNMFRLVILATHFADETRGNGKSFPAPLLAGSGAGQREMVLGPGNADVTQSAFFVDGRSFFVDCTLVR